MTYAPPITSTFISRSILVVALNDASPYIFVAGTENVLAESVGVPIETVSVLLVLVALVNCPATAA